VSHIEQFRQCVKLYELQGLLHAALKKTTSGGCRGNFMNFLKDAGLVNIAAGVEC
jgi:hypothetical protein